MGSDAGFIKIKRKKCLERIAIQIKRLQSLDEQLDKANKKHSKVSMQSKRRRKIKQLETK